MDSIVIYFAAAMSDTPEAFERRFPYPLLVREPDAGASMPKPLPMDEEPEIATSATNVMSAAMLSAIEDEDAGEQWIVIPLVTQRRSSQPPPVTYVRNRGLQLSMSHSSAAPLVAGRSRACEVHLPFSSVSHIHAHFFVNRDFSVDIIDQSSTNGTFVSNQRLTPSVKKRARSGDLVRFGGVTLRLLDPRGFYLLLRAHQERAPGSDSDL